MSAAKIEDFLDRLMPLQPHVESKYGILLVLHFYCLPFPELIRPLIELFISLFPCISSYLINYKIFKKLLT